MKFMYKYLRYIKMAIFLVIYFLLLFTSFSSKMLSPIARIYGSSYEGARAYLVFSNVIIYLILFVLSLLLVPQIYYLDCMILKRKNFSRAFLEVLIGYGILTVASVFGTMISRMLAGGGESINETAVNSIIFADGGWLYIFVAVIIGPIVEEIVFRGILQGAIIGSKVRKPGDPRVVVGILASSIFFGLIHVVSGGDYIFIFPYLFMGLALGIIAYYSKSVYTSMIVHILNNLISILITLLYVWGI